MSTKLNTQVAERMGWTRIGPDSWRDVDGVTREVGAYLPYYFKPSGCENDAGLVLNRIMSLGWTVTVYGGPHPDHKYAITRVCIMRRPGDAVLAGVVDVVNEVRPLAICLAFVEAMARWGDEPKN